MPLYTFEHKNTEEKITVECSFNELAAVQAEFGEEWRRVFRVNLSSSGGRDIISRTSEGWKDRLRAIKKANPGSTINV